MALPNLPFGIRVALEYNLNGKLVVNIYHVISDQPITSVALDNVAERFRDWAVNTLLILLSEEISLVAVTALDISVPDGEKELLVVSPPESGGVVGDALPNNVAAVMTFNTAKTGRSFQGRTYIPGISEFVVSQNEMGEVAVAALLAAYAGLLTSLDIGDFTLVVASFYSENELRLEGVGTPVTALLMNRRVDTQRRRLPAS